MHIAFATIESPFEERQRGGVAASLRALLPGLLAAGHKISVLAPSSSCDFQHSNLHVYHAPLSSAHWYFSRIPVLGNLFTHLILQIEWSFCFYRAFRRYDVHPDVIESGELGGLFLHKIAPLIVRLHGNDFIFKKKSGESIPVGIRISRGLDKKIYKKAAALIAPSQAQAAAILEDCPGISGKMNVIANAVAVEEFAAIPPQKNSDQGSSVLFYNGRIASVKGVDILLKAFAEVRKKNQGARLILAGRWQMPHPPSDWGLELGKNHNGVEWAGPVSAEQIKAFYAAADIFVMPSRYETFGLSVLEAMAAGLPVVAANTGALPELVENRITGILTPPGDALSMAAGILELLENPDLRKKMGEAGRQRALECFDLKRAMDQTISLYEKCAVKNSTRNRSGVCDLSVKV